MKPTQLYGDVKTYRPPPTLGDMRPLAATEPQHVLYRGRVRRVRAVVAARHQGHRYFVLAYKRGHALPF